MSPAIVVHANAADRETKASSKKQQPVPSKFLVRSHRFPQGDRVTIKGLKPLAPNEDGQTRYEVRGQYTLGSRDAAMLRLGCANGRVKGDRSLQIRRGRGEFEFQFTIVRKGDLHLTYYPAEGGSSLGSLYFDPATGKFEPPTDKRPTRSTSDFVWKTINSQFFRLHHTEQFEQDATQAKRFLEKAVDDLAEQFEPTQTRRLLSEASIDIYLYPRSVPLASEGTATLNTRVKGGVYYGEIHMLTLGAHKSGRTSVNLPKDEHHIHKTLIHEYATILLDRITRKKSEGWKFFSAPSWFVQGYEEYLGIMLSSDRNRQVTREKYRDLIRKDPKRISREFQVKNAYLDGANLVDFLHEEYGKRRVRELLESGKPDFWSAVEDALGVDQDELYDAWQDWARKL